MAVAKKPSKAGRKPKFIPNQETLDYITKLAAKGLTKEKIAVSIGVGISYIFELEKKYPEITEAIEKGRSKLVVEASDVMTQIMRGNGNTNQVVYPNHQIDAAKFVLERRCGWIAPKDDVNLNIDQSKKLEMHFHFNDGVKKEVVEIEKENTTKIIDT